MNTKPMFAFTTSICLMLSACNAPAEVDEDQAESSDEVAAQDLSQGGAATAETDETYEVCDESGNRYASEADAAAAGLSYAEYGATFCEYIEEATDPSSSASNESVRPCLEAVAKQVGTDEVSFLRLEYSEAATGVYVSVAGAEAPWLCTAWGDEVAGVMYTGDEGAL